jgi:hypothetical protein
MQDQPRMKPMRAFHDLGQEGPAAPVAGTVARDEGGNPYLLTGYNGRTVGNQIPFPVTRDVLERGRERFDIFCAPCHARTGEGNGMIVQRGYRRPPSFHTDRLRSAPLGHFFEVMSHGFGAMPDYNSQVPVRDRWAIAEYIRVLQFSQNAPASLKPPDAAMDEPPALSGTPGSGATPGDIAPQSGNLQVEEGPASAVQKKAAEEKKKREEKDKEVGHQ